MQSTIFFNIKVETLTSSVSLVYFIHFKLISKNKIPGYVTSKSLKGIKENKQIPWIQENAGEEEN